MPTFNANAQAGGKPLEHGKTRAVAIDFEYRASDVPLTLRCRAVKHPIRTFHELATGCHASEVGQRPNILDDRMGLRMALLSGSDQRRNQKQFEGKCCSHKVIVGIAMLEGLDRNRRRNYLRQSGL